MIRREELKQLELPKTVNSHQWLTFKVQLLNKITLEKEPQPFSHKLWIDLCGSNLAVGH